MPRSKKEPTAPSKTAHLFAPRKAKDRPDVTHESLSADIAAFRKAGGRIEVLGVTRSLLRIGNDGDAAPPMPATPPPTPSRRWPRGNTRFAKPHNSLEKRQRELAKKKKKDEKNARKRDAREAAPAEAAQPAQAPPPAPAPEAPAVPAPRIHLRTPTTSEPSGEAT
jgi:hypothetical protein